MLYRVFAKLIRLLMGRKSNLALPLFCTIALAILLSPLFPSICSAKKVTLGWDANPEPDLEGYVIYRNVGSPGPPYKFSSTLPEDDLANPLHPRVTLTGLKKNTKYYIALTAYNTEGVESSFSNDVCVEIVDSIVENCTSSLRTSGSITGGGSGGGAACFIKSAGGDVENAAVLGVILAFGFLVIGAIMVFLIAFRQHLHETSN
jgi:hypothetical protein